MVSVSDINVIGVGVRSERSTSRRRGVVEKAYALAVNHVSVSLLRCHSGDSTSGRGGK